jgi:hypothetical protein
LVKAVRLHGNLEFQFAPDELESALHRLLHLFDVGFSIEGVAAAVVKDDLARLGSHWVMTHFPPTRILVRFTPSSPFISQAPWMASLGSAMMGGALGSLSLAGRGRAQAKIATSEMSSRFMILR